jgi:hypothetical protein
MKNHCISMLMPFMVAVIVLLTPQCKRIDAGIDQFRLFREQAVYEINTASKLISEGTGSITQVLENLAERFPKELRHSFSFDVPFIIDVVSSETIVVGLCLTDAAASKALYLLELLKSEIITGEVVPLPDPFICNPSVPTLNMNQDKSQRTVLTFTGYNLFMQHRFNAALFNAQGDSIPLEVGRPNSYQIDVSLEGYDDNFLEKFKYLSVFYDGTPISSLFVVKKYATEPVTKLVSPAPAPGTIAVYPFTLNDDPGFGGDCAVSVTLTFGHDKKRAWVDMRMFVEELNGFHRTYASTGIFAKRTYYYTAPVGWHIKNFQGQPITDNHHYTDYSNEDDIRYNRYGQLTIKAKGSVAGSTTSAVMSFNTNVPDILIESDN